MNPVGAEPFRQSSSSTHVYTPITDDAIVIVGQSSARQRKRKREKSSGGASTPRPGQDTDVIAFDYSSVPNLLDGSMEREKVGENDGKNKKSRQSKSESSGVSFLVVQNWFLPLRNWMVIFLFCFSPCVTCYSGFFFLFTIHELMCNGLVPSQVLDFPRTPTSDPHEISERSRVVTKPTHSNENMTFLSCGGHTTMGTRFALHPSERLQDACPVPYIPYNGPICVHGSIP